MDNDTRTNDTPTNGSAAGPVAGEPPAASLHQANGGLPPGGSLTNADVAALSRERLQTLLSILPPAVAAILITNRPPMPPHVEYEAHKKLVAALAKARAKIPSVPMDKTVDYVSKRTGERVHYTFASLDSVHKTVTEPLSEHGLVLECVFNGDVIVVLLSHEEGGIHLSWLPLPNEGDIKDLATQITMRRRYLTNQLIAIVADEDTGERDIAEPKKGPQRRGAQPGRQRPAAAPPANRGRAAGPAGGAKGRPQAPRRRRAARQPHQRATGQAPQGRRRRAAPAPHRPERAAAAHHRGAEPPQRRQDPRRGRRRGRPRERAAAAGRGAAERRAAPGPGRRRRPAADARQRPAREAHQRRHAGAQAQPRRAGGAAQPVPGRPPETLPAHQGAVQRRARRRVREHVTNITNRAGLRLNRAGRACA